MDSKILLLQFPALKMPRKERSELLPKQLPPKAASTYKEKKCLAPSEANGAKAGQWTHAHVVQIAALIASGDPIQTPVRAVMDPLNYLSKTGRPERETRLNSYSH